MQLLFSFDRGMKVEKTLMQTLASQLSSTLIQLLFSFDRGMEVDETLMQTLASQLSFNQGI
jgi:exonuclease VII small subunit